MQIQVRVHDNVTKKLALVRPRIIPNLRLAVRDSLNVVENKAQQSVSSKLRVRTGRLMRSIKAGAVRIKGNKVIGKLPDRPRAKSSGWYYGMFHEKGAVIKPKKKKYLAIPMPDGTVRFVKQVILPRRQWLKPAIDKSVFPINRIIRKYINRIFG